MDSGNDCKRFACSPCNKNFQSLVKLNKHIKNNHPSKEASNTKYVTDLERTLNQNEHSDSSEQRSYFLRNSPTNVEEKIKYDIDSTKKKIGQRFNKKSKIHQSNDIDENTKDFQCDICYKFYRTRRCLHDHKRIYHRVTHFKIAERTLECNSCHKKYRYRRGVLEHIRRHHPSQVKPKSEHQFRKENECSICHRLYSYRRGLYEHIRNFHPEFTEQKIKNFKCDICYKKYSYKRGLREHMKTRHPTSVTYKNSLQLKKCDFCDQEYRFSHLLYKHVKKEHFVTIDKDKKFTCVICHKRYSNRRNIVSHILKNHRTNISTKKDVKKPLECAFCGRMFLSRDKLIGHIQNRHCSVEKKENNEGRFKRGMHVCPLCMASFAKKCDILHHLHNIHKIDIREEFYEHGDMQSFENWKDRMELSTRSKYVLYNKYKTDSEVVITFVCHRTACCQTKVNGIGNTRPASTNKMSYYCPAEIQLRTCEERKGYFVHFISSHVGHDTNEHSELQCPKSPIGEREGSTKALPVGLRSSNSDDVTWYRLNNDVNDILTFSNSNENVFDTEEPEFLTSTDDYSEIESWINKNTDYVLYHKVKNMTDSAFPKLQTSDFVLIIANEYQLEMLRNFGTEIIGLNGGYEPSICDFELTIVSVFDNFVLEFPCAFMFSNRNDEYVYRILCSKIKEKIGETGAKVFISGVNERYRNAWDVVMPLPNTHLFCSRHVLREWKVNSSKIEAPEKRHRTKIRLETMRTELNPYRFHELLQNFVDDIDPDTQEFRDYFEIRFQRNVSAWAYCYRKHTRVNTIAEVEKFFVHAEKKRAHDGTPLSVRGGLEVLCEMLENLYSEKVQIEVDAKLVPKNTYLRKKHLEVAKNIEKIKSVSKLSEENWCVPSFSDEETMHSVELIDEICECELRCEACNVCLHQFICSCVENCIEFNMCEHIHLVCLFENESKRTVEGRVAKDRRNVNKV